MLISHFHITDFVVISISGTSSDVANHRLYWTDISIASETNNSQQVLVNFDGIPHTVPGHYELNCQFGVDLNQAARKKKSKVCTQGFGF